ncbi:hypothetical protein HMY34_19680 [Thiothrix subterranea]|uniref:hypothetical protein n=1 Tax=Thiothrix subterranea TaxID=2735563 RepID=UPI00192A8982|nr:hypothetical protein [Thiothrix subterranea]QQZ30795.1 hypothetical protein HMY34_19680 [Thiothrix subterranea]
MPNNLPFSPEYQNNLARAYASGVAMLRTKTEHPEAKKIINREPVQAIEYKPVSASERGVMWEVKILTSNVVVRVWFPDRPIESRFEEVALPISVLAQPLANILGAVSLLTGAPVPTLEQTP